MKLGNRIKRYEAVTRNFATPRMPLIIRVDGRAFHTFTKHINRPFDAEFMNAMVDAAIATATDMQGFKAAYIQSDEVTFLLTDYDSLETQGWFNYNINKMVSISAAMMTVNFANKYCITDILPMFDSRAFNVPVHDVVNTFLWRAKDWERNSLQMYARNHFSHKSLVGKKRNDMHEMLHSIDKNWATDLTQQEKNGTFIIPSDDGVMVKTYTLPNYNAINNIITGY